MATTKRRKAAPKRGKRSSAGKRTGKGLLWFDFLTSMPRAGGKTRSYRLLAELWRLAEQAEQHRLHAAYRRRQLSRKRRRRTGHGGYRRSRP